MLPSVQLSCIYTVLSKLFLLILLYISFFCCTWTDLEQSGLFRCHLQQRRQNVTPASATIVCAIAVALPDFFMIMAPKHDPACPDWFTSALMYSKSACTVSHWSDELFSPLTARIMSLQYAYVAERLCSLQGSCELLLRLIYKRKFHFLMRVILNRKYKSLSTSKRVSQHTFA